MTSSASVHSILSALEREGLIKRIPNVSRGIELVPQETAINVLKFHCWSGSGGPTD